MTFLLSYFVSFLEWCILLRRMRVYLNEMSKEMGSCTRIISAGDKIIRKISCLPHVRLRRDCTFDSAACAEDRHFTHTSMISSRHGEGVITNDTKRLHAPLQPQCLLAPNSSEYAVWSSMRIQRKNRATKNFTIAWALTAFKSQI